MKVLVVDDDVVSRMVLMHLVDACGAFEVVEAEDGADAWAQLSGGLRPAICFCDLRMPNVSGMELLARVKADPDLAGTAFVMVSSATEGDIVDAAILLGAAGYIVKPFQADQVRRHLDQLVLNDASAGSQDETQADPQADPQAEAPHATMQRLGINSERLLAYLGGFLNQISTASSELPALLDHDRQAARVRIERLHAGCTTLGLNRAAATLSSLAGGPLDAAEVLSALSSTASAVSGQSDAVRRQFVPA